MAVQEITLKDIPSRTIVYIHCSGSWRQLPEMISRLQTYVSQNSIETKGPVSGIYYNTPNEVSTQDLRWDVFYLVSSNNPESSDNTMVVGVRNLPETKMASIIHKDSYRKADSSYERLEEWIKQEGLKACGPSEEVYVSVFDVPSEEQIMEIRIPVSSI